MAAAAVTATAQDATRAVGTAPTTIPAPAMSDIQQYRMWSRFKTGSTATLTGDLNLPGGKAHVVITRTLKAVTADTVTLTLATRTAAAGRNTTDPEQTSDVPARVASDQPTLIGTAATTAMGKTFTCEVYLLPHLAGIEPSRMYVNPDVPGGVVKVIPPGTGGQWTAMTLTDMAIK